MQAAPADGYLPGADTGRVAFAMWAAVHGGADLILQARGPGHEADAAQLGGAVVEQIMDWIESTRPS